MHLGTVFAISIFALFAWPIVGNTQPNQVDRNALKLMYLQGLDYPIGLQDVEWGPFIGGGSFRIQYEYIPPAGGSKYLRGSAPACVQIDRGDMLRAGYLIDAFYECEKHGLCQSLPQYSDKLFSTQNEDELPFIEEFDPDLAPKMHDWTLQHSDAESWLDAMIGVVLGVQTHEFAHALLHSDKEMNADLEAEADGFSAYIREIAKVEVNPAPGQTYSLSSTALVLTQFVNAERSFDLSQGSHPPSECRIEAAKLGLSRWYHQRPHLIPPADFTPEDVRSFLQGALQPFLPKQAGLCDKYEVGFHRGVQKAAALISVNTDIKFNFEGGGRRCDVTAR